MELFSVTCITCRASLKVRHESAIGQILACPRCQGMVQIEAPPGWKPPPKPSAAMAASAASRERKLPESSAIPQAVPVEEESLVPPGHLTAPHEVAARRWILIGGGAVAAAILAFGLWSTFGSPSSVEDSRPVIEPNAVATVTPKPMPTPKPSASPSIAKPVPTATPSKTPVADAPGSPEKKKPTVVEAAAPAPVAPLPTAPLATAPTPTPPVTDAPGSLNEPVPVVAATAPLPKPPPDTETIIPPPTIDLPARLKDQLLGLSFDKVPLKAALDVISQLSTIRINYDWDSLEGAKIKLDEPVTLKLDEVYVGAALARLLEGRGLEYVPIGDQLLVFHPPRDEPPTSVDYPVDDLLGSGEKGLADLAAMLRLLVVPTTWDTAGGKGTIVADSNKLTVSQTPRRHAAIASFFDRLRLARGKTPRDPATTLDTRISRAAEILQKPVTMNFRPAAPLERVLGFLETTTGAMITVDYLSLYSYGFQGEPIGCSAEKHSAADVLTSLCAPREWAWRIIDAKTLEITSRESLRRRLYCEFYPVKDLLDGELTGPRLAARLRTQLADEGWREAGGRGEIFFDEPAGALIVCQHQEAHRRIEQSLAESAKKP